MENTSDPPAAADTIILADRRRWLLASIDRIMILADVRELELIYGFSKELVNEK